MAVAGVCALAGTEPSPATHHRHTARPARCPSFANPPSAATSRPNAQGRPLWGRVAVMAPGRLQRWRQAASSGTSRPARTRPPTACYRTGSHVRSRNARPVARAPEPRLAPSRHTERYQHTAPYALTRSIRPPTPSRVAALRSWRAIDPTAARCWLKNALDQERARERAALLATLEPHLDADDEPLLEARPRRSGKRRASDGRPAALTPTRLSHWSAVMESRAASHLQWRAHPEGFGEIVVDLPRQLDAAARRDGVTEIAPHGGGKRAWWLRLFVEAVPPQRWCERWGATSCEIVRAAARSDWADVLLAAFGNACTRHRSPTWAQALLEERLIHGPNLWAQLPCERAEILLGRWLAREGRTGSPARALAEVVRLDGDWSPKFSRAVATSIRTLVERNELMSHAQMRHMLGVCSLRMAPIAHEAVRDQLLRSLEPNPWSPSFDRLVQVLGFRAAMLHELERSNKARQA